MNQNDLFLPLGFRYGGVACGIKPSGKLDVAIIATIEPAVAAGVYTQNVVRAASIDWNRNITPTDCLRGIVINSGNANACTGQRGIEDNAQMAALTANYLMAQPDQIAVLSTGVIGQTLNMETVASGIEQATQSLSDGPGGFRMASEAILTTDQSSKVVSHQLEIAGKPVRLAGMAKGAGMIGPNMATMLAIVTTDAQIDPGTAQCVLTNAANQSFNRISVEGHTSTNDALILVCSGHSGATLKSDKEIQQFESVLTSTCIDLAKLIPSDGEGASHLVSISINGAQSESDAETVARTIAASALVKTAITGNDPNWGRIVSAAGYSGIDMKAEQIDLSINGHCVFKSGQPADFDESIVSKSMASSFECLIELSIGTGPSSATHWTSDLTVDYVRFNSEYTT